MSFKLGATSLTGADFLFNSNSFLNIAHGAVRSGKTIMATVRFLEHIKNSPHNRFLICGTTRDTIERNIINDLIGIIEGEHSYKYNKIDGKLIIDNNTIYLIGLNNERVTDKIKGVTLGGAYIDEVTTIPRSSFEMILTRCSLTGSKIFCTTNPDSPYHWLYTDYISNQDLLDSGYVKTWKFLIEDNPHLSPEYIDQMKHINSKSSTHYRRNILGEWVAAEGRIYEHFNEDNIIKTEDLPDRYDLLSIGCDYGVSAPNCFLVVGAVFNETGTEYYVMDEVYHDPERAGYSQTDEEKLADILKLKEKYKLSMEQFATVYVPHDAASLYTTLEYADGLDMFVESFKPDILECIGFISDAFYDNKLFVVADNCPELVKQLDTYSWDSKAQQKGIDMPLKVNDHAVDALRAPIMKMQPVIDYADIVKIW